MDAYVLQDEEQQQQQAPQQQGVVMMKDFMPPGMTPYGGYGAPRGHVHASDKPVRVPTKDWDAKLPVCAVILTVNNGSSYDHLFTEVEQEPPEPGVAISLWQLRFEHLKDLLAALRGDADATKASEILEIVSDIQRAVPSSVLLNFECCGGCNDQQGFPCDVMPIIKLFLDRQHIVAVGDFSTKAMIRSWDATLLGPCPFVRTQTLSSNFELRFNPQTLLECPNAQLARVGELCRAKGSCTVGAMGGTCMFTVDKEKADTSAYKLQVLTVMTVADGVEVPQKECSCTFEGVTHKGSVGHALLTYPSKKEGGEGGLLILSAGHWIELSRLDTDVHFVKQKILDQYGAQAAADFECAYASSTPEQQQQQVQASARKFVQSAAPVAYGYTSKKY